MKETKIAVIGCGNLGKALVHGLIESKAIAAQNLVATRRNITPIKDLKKLGVNVTKDNTEALKKSKVAIIALKPYNILETLDELRGSLDAHKHVIVSVATGITIESIEAVVGKEFAIIRAMPNTAADVKESVTCLAANKAGKKHIELIKKIFNQIGVTIEIEEDLMEAATVLGACGVAFVLRFMRAMVQGGIQIGFSARVANEIVNHLVKGSADLLIQRGEHPEFEIDKVTTPKGCTIVGLNEMEHNGFSSSLIRGIVASFEKIEK